MTTVHLSGNIDHQTSTAARTHLLVKLSSHDGLHIDLSNVTWIDSAGLAILVEVYLAARKINQKVHLINIRHDVRKKIRLAHLEGVFALHGANKQRTIH